MILIIFICFYFSFLCLFICWCCADSFFSHFAVVLAHAQHALIETPHFIIQHNTQSKCSIFHDVMLCLCLNLTYANVVRFPRELDRHGVAFLIPYLLLFLLVGMPIILLEIALGQFLGQGSAHSWRASPIFRGKFIIEHKIH